LSRPGHAGPGRLRGAAPPESRPRYVGDPRRRGDRARADRRRALDARPAGRRRAEQTHGLAREHARDDHRRRRAGRLSVDGQADLVLVVDDNEAKLYRASRVLRGAGFEVLEARTAADALRIAREQAPRLVVLDVKLPDINGWEVCRRLKGDPTTAAILVLQLSASYVS